MSTTATERSRITESELSHYYAEGYVLINRPILPESSFDGLRAFFEEQFCALPADERPEQMDKPHFTKPELYEWLFHDDILDLVEPILGPDIALFASHFIAKPRGDGKRVPWHEDSAYWKGMLEPVEAVTVWLAIDPSMVENGCMYVAPRSHLTPDSDYSPVDTAVNVFPTEIVKGQMDESKAVPCILRPNEASLHNARTAHGSPPNTSNIRRCGFTMRYVSTATRMTDSAQEYHITFLARGRDLSGTHRGDPSKRYDDLLAIQRSGRMRGH